MKTATLTAVAIISALALAGCGSSSNSTTSASSPSSSAERFTPGEVTQALLDWDNAASKRSFSSDDGCHHLQVKDDRTGWFYAAAWIVVSPSDACDASMEVAQHASRIDRNIWMQWSSGVSTAERVMIQASAAAADAVLVASA